MAIKNPVSHFERKVPRSEKGYFKNKLEPQIDGNRVRLTGEVNDETKERFLAGAAALLFPIEWPEPFGLVMIEAMACGTPVIAFRSGSVPEVVDQGVTGFIVEDEDQAVQAIGHLGELDRRKIRAHFEQRFAASRMATQYLHHYEAVRGKVDAREGSVRQRAAARTGGELGSSHDFFIFLSERGD